MADTNDLDIVVLECPGCGAFYDDAPFGTPHGCVTDVSDDEQPPADRPNGRKVDHAE